MLAFRNEIRHFSTRWDPLSFAFSGTRRSSSQCGASVEPALQCWSAGDAAALRYSHAWLCGRHVAFAGVANAGAVGACRGNLCRGHSDHYLSHVVNGVLLAVAHAVPSTCVMYQYLSHVVNGVLLAVVVATASAYIYDLYSCGKYNYGLYCCRVYTYGQMYLRPV